MKTNTTSPSTIGQEAESEIWEQIRKDTHRKLVVSLTIGVLYLLASLVVGVFLIYTVEEVGRDTVYLQGWELQTVDLQWMTKVRWFYGGIGALAMLAYAVIYLTIQNLLPPIVWRRTCSIAWVGSTIRMVAIADVCQSIYHSVRRGFPYDKAFARAASEVQSVGMRCWLSRAAERIQAGQSPAAALRSCPVQDQPFAAVAVITSGELTKEETIEVWHQATMECHALAFSRLNRATQVISVTCLLCSAGLAAFALIVSARFMSALLQGLT